MSRLTLAALLLTLSHSAVACGFLAPAEDRAAIARDLLHQAQLVAELASEADAVVVADVVATSDEGVSLQVVEYLVGTGSTERRVQPSTYLHAIGCLASASFRNVTLRPGTRYVLYLSGSQVLRAGEFERSAEALPVSEELELVRRSART